MLLREEMEMCRNVGWWDLRLTPAFTFQDVETEDILFSVQMREEYLRNMSFAQGRYRFTFSYPLFY